MDHVRKMEVASYWSTPMGIDHKLMARLAR
jgi:hypothetical protein